MNYTEYLDTDYWKEVSRQVKSRAGFRCQVCNSQHELCAHHRTYEHRGDELKHLDDLICLCRRCHGIFHGTLVDPKQVVVKVERVEIPQAVKSKKKRHRYATDKELDVSADLPGWDPIILNDDLIARCRTKAGGFTNATLAHLGIKRNPSKGWVARLIGKSLPRDQYKQALEGRCIYNSGSLPK